MRKFVSFILVAMLVFALATPALAANIPAGGITITAQTIDYVSALAGIARPVSTAYTANERFAVLVSINIPQWIDTTGMTAVVDSTGLMLDSVAPLPVATGNYIVLGTLCSNAAVLTITLQDNALASATTAQQLWAALYGDRSASCTLNFAPVIQPTQQATVPDDSMLPPQTGERGAQIGMLLCAAALLCSMVLVRRWCRK